jgi:hypothetical protein
MKTKLVESPEMKQILKLTGDNIIDDIKIKDKCMFMVEAELLEEYEGNNIWDDKKEKPKSYQTFLITDIKKYQQK